MLTNFGKLTNEQKTVWSKDLWRRARNMSFINQFLGTGPNALIQHITELTRDEKGERAVLTLLADLVGDGVAGDRTLEGNEEPIVTAEQVITLDQIRNANRHEGRMAAQATTINFRTASRDVLSYWLADRTDQLAFLTMSGVNYARTNNGALRVGSDFVNLAYAADVKAPSANRRLRWDGASKSLVSNAATTDLSATDKITWQTFVQLKAYAKDRYMRGVGDASEGLYHAFLSPTAMATLKADPDYNLNLRHAQGAKNSSLFTGAAVTIDGIALHEFRHVYNTSNAPMGSKWGATGTVNGCQVLFAGAQALGFADIGEAYWDEEGFDYSNQQGIAIGKIMGFLKPQFPSIYENGLTEDFGVISCYVAQ